MAATRLIEIHGPASGSHVGGTFCASGTADQKVSAVKIELYVDDNPVAVYSTSARIDGGQWQTPITLPTLDPNLRYTLKVFYASPGDGGSVVQLQYDSSVADDDCSG
jgi:hypothetical protein